MKEERSIIVPVKILHGSIKCARCETTLQAAGACPKCCYTHVVVRMGWKGKTYRFYHDKHLRAHDFSSAAVDLASQNGEIATGTFDPKKWLKPVIEARLLQSAWDEFMCEKIEEIQLGGDFAVSTWKMYQTHYLVWIKPTFGNIDLMDFPDPGMKRLEKALAKKSRHYRINVFTTFHAFLCWARDERGYIKMLPKFPDLSKPLAESRRRESLTVEEQDEIFARIAEPTRDVFVFEAEIGCRPGESGLICLEDIDRNRMLHIKRTFSAYELRDRTKEGSIREIALSDTAIEIAKKYLIDPETGTFRTTGLLFKNPVGRPKWGPYRPEFLRRRYREAAGMDMPDHYAATRTSFDTQMAETGELSEKEWMALTGHSSKEAADRYFHNRPGRQVALVNKRRRAKVIVFKKDG
jgi:integrase